MQAVRMEQQSGDELERAGNKVFIVGAGIAGLALARFLGRREIRSQIVEQAPAFGDVGAGLQIAPNATRLLHRLGYEDELRSIAQALASRRVFDSEGNLLSDTPLGQLSLERFGAPYYAVHRAKLHSMLLGPDDLDISLGDPLLGVTHLSNGAQIEFRSGRRETHALVVGADGIRSTVRDSVVRDEPTFSGQSMFRSLVPTDAVSWPDDLDGLPRVRVYAGPRQHLVAYPIGGGLLNVAATVPREDWIEESWSHTESPEVLREAYRGWAAPVGGLLDAITATQRWAIFERPALAQWSTSHSTLIGDAAHPMLPFLAQGANQAIEDAATLALYLWNVPAMPLAEALQGYEDARMQRVRAVVERSRTNVSSVRATRGVNDGLETFDWLYGYDAELVASCKLGRLTVRGAST